MAMFDSGYNCNDPDCCGVYDPDDYNEDLED